MRNRLHVFMASNEKWAVPASLEARRFAVFDVSGKRQRDGAYFNRLYRAVEKREVLGAMLAELQGYDLSGFNVFAIPNTSSLQEQKIHSLTGVNAWLLEILTADEYRIDKATVALGSHPGNPKGWHATNVLHAAYCEWAAKRPREKNPEPRNMFGQYLKCAQAKRATMEPRPYGYEFRTIEEARAKFREQTGLVDAFDEDEEREEDAA
jgi:hypothetical protein